MIQLALKEERLICNQFLPTLPGIPKEDDT